MALVKQLNTNAHLAHNGGWWLNKFTEKSIMDYIANGHILETIRALFACGPMARKARISEPVTQHAAIPAPAIPPALRQIYVGNNICRVQYRDENGVLSIGKIALSGAEESALLGFISQLEPPRKRCMQGGDKTFYKLTQAFSACIELALPSVYERINNVKPA